MLFVVALLPILVLISFVLVLKRSVVFSATAALITAVIAAIYWGVSTQVLFAASARGLFVATEIILIIIGALIMVKAVQSRGLFKQLEILITSLSSDYRVQTMMVSFGVVYFIEGVAGFGTPAIVAVPLFMALGFRAVSAVTLTLIADSIPVSFGAIGLPITFGVGSVVDTIATDPQSVTSQVVFVTAAINVFMSVLLALLLTATVIRLKNGKIKAFIEFVPFAVISGLAVGIPSFIIAISFGPELPSVVGGLVGLFIIGLLAHHNIGIPKDAAQVELDNKELKIENRQILHADKAIYKSLSPYVLLIVLLVLSRLPYLPIGDWLRSVRFGSDSLLGSQITYFIAPLYSTAAILLICAAFTVAVSWRHMESPKNTIIGVLKSVLRPFAALLLVLVFVQIFIYSGTDLRDSMPLLLAQNISSFSGSYWPFVAPFIGALGAFISGSATVSNLIFSGLQYDIAVAAGLPAYIMLSIQTVGASIGNMIALHNIVAALTIAGVTEHYSHRIIKNNLTPAAVLLVAAGSIGLLLSI